MRHQFIGNAPTTHATLFLATLGVIVGTSAVLSPARAAAGLSTVRSPGGLIGQDFLRGSAGVQAAADGSGLAAATPARVRQAGTARSAVTAALPPSAGPAAVQDACPPEAIGAVCGHVDVPLDRRHRGGATIAIAFELYPHTDPGPAQSAIIVNFGGPGASTAAVRAFVPFWLGPPFARHDVLLIDDRGRGLSGAIDCPDFQHGTGVLLEAVGECASQLGATATDYSTADIAADDEAVRVALGYNLVDFAGTSYGGIDAAAYATRFPGHLRSLLLDSPVGVPALDPIPAAAGRTRRDIALIGVLCSRSAACGRSAATAVGSVRRLAERVRRDPVTGTGLDADGVRHDVTIDPTYLLVHILDSTGGPFLTPAEVPAAADALARGDSVPLLRLAAETDFAIPGDSGDPADFSQGAFSATLCLDSPWPWSPDAALSVRQAQWTRAVHNTPDSLFGPFHADEILFSVFGLSDFCLPWPQTGSRPPVERGARYPDVPTLVLQGELDALPFVPQTAAPFPDAKLITVTGAGHNTFGSGPCGSELAVQFLNTLKVADASCAANSPLNYPGVTAFPRVASESPAATAERRNRSGASELRVARVAADAALDALKRSFLNSGDGPGLRGGTFHAHFGDSALTITLTATRWTEDVVVSGTLHWDFSSGALDADLQIDGPGRQDGFLHLHGGWVIPGAGRLITITGTLDGAHVAATVPST